MAMECTMYREGKTVLKRGVKGGCTMEENMGKIPSCKNRSHKYRSIEITLSTANAFVGYISKCQKNKMDRELLHVVS